MSEDDLTDEQISLLCDIEEHDPSMLTGERARDLERLLSGGYVEQREGNPQSAFKLTAKGYMFLGERGAG